MTNKCPTKIQKVHYSPPQKLPENPATMGNQGNYRNITGKLPNKYLPPPPPHEISRKSTTTHPRNYQKIRLPKETRAIAKKSHPLFPHEISRKSNTVHPRNYQKILLPEEAREITKRIRPLPPSPRNFEKTHHSPPQKFEKSANQRKPGRLTKNPPPLPHEISRKSTTIQHISARLRRTTILYVYIYIHIYKMIYDI